MNLLQDWSFIKYNKLLQKIIMNDFKFWINKKAWLHNQNNRPFFKERDIWYCYFGVNVGFEQDGQGQDFLRPVMVFKKFNKEIFLGIPLTRSIKDLSFYFSFEFKAGLKSSAILSQIRFIDAKRLSHKIGVINKINFNELIKNSRQFCLVCI